MIRLAKLHKTDMILSLNFGFLPAISCRPDANIYVALSTNAIEAGSSSFIIVIKKVSS